jgi:hypothetical protein
VGQTNRYRSFFWPAVLILAGLIALLVNTGQITSDRLIELVSLWPVILIVLGLEIVVRTIVRGPAGDVAAALIIVVAVVGSAAYVAAAPNPSAPHTVDASAAVGDLHQATLEVNAGGARINITEGSDIGSNLYQAHIQYANEKPDVGFDRSTGLVVISEHNENFLGFQTGPFVLDIRLNTGVTWTITENTGASSDTINLPNIQVSGVTVNTGASTENITLSKPSGVVPIKVNGGALTVHIHRPGGTEASVMVSGGVTNLTADGHSSHAIGNVSYESPGFVGASAGYRIGVDGGACNVTLDTTTASG